MKRVKILLLIGAIILLTACGGGSSEVMKEKELNNSYTEKTVIITPDNLIAEYEGVKIAFSAFDIDAKKTLTMQRIKPQSFNDSTDYQIKLYDFTLKEKSKCKCLIEITIPYDKAFINNKSELDSIFAVYYNSDTKLYEPIEYTIDTQTHEIKIITNHLSAYGLVEAKNSVRHDSFLVINEYTSKAKIIGIVASHGYPSSEKAINAIKTFDSDSGTSYDAFEAGFGTANFWLGLSATGNTVASAGYASDFLQSLGNSFNAVGLGASIVQAGVDIQKGDIQSLYSNFLKNYVYNAVNYFGTGALQLAFVGVFAIDLSLNHVITVTLNDNEKKYAKVYDACYNEFYNKSAVEWYEDFKKIWKKSKNPIEMGKAIQKAVDDNVNEVWNVANILNLEKHTGKGTELLRGLLFVSNIITQAKKEELLTGKLKPVFTKMSEMIHKDNKNKYIKELSKLRDKLNQDINVQIKETIKEGETSKYAGYTFRFAPLSYETKKSSWTATLHEDGSFYTHFTVLGHMQAGAPDKLEIYKPEDDPDTDNPVRSIEFKITPPNLVINIDKGGVCGDNGCDFSKLNTVKIAFSIKQTDFMYGPYSYTNPETGETLTNQYDHSTGTYSTPSSWEDANFLTCSITDYNSGTFSSSCFSSEFKYDLSIIFTLDSETEPSMFKTVKIHMTDKDGSSIYANYRNIPLDFSGMQIDDNGLVTTLKDSLHGDIGSSTFCGYFQNLSGFYYSNYGDGTINKFELQSYDCSKGGKVFIDMNVK